MIVADKSPSLRFHQALEAAGLASLLDATPGIQPSRAQIEALVKPENLLLTAQLANQRRLALWGNEITYCQWSRRANFGVQRPEGIEDWPALLAWAKAHPEGIGPEPLHVARLAETAGLSLQAAAEALAATGLTALLPTTLPAVADESWQESLQPFADAGLSLSAAVSVTVDGGGLPLVERLGQIRRWQSAKPFLQALIPVPVLPDPLSGMADVPTGFTILQAIALTRIVADNVPHVSAAWPRLGVKAAQIALSFGADDWLGTDDVEPDDAGGPMTDDRSIELITTARLVPLARGAAFPQRRSR